MENVFNNCELWYYKSALKFLSIERQIKVLLIVSNYIDNKCEVTFENLMKDIYLNYKNVKRIRSGAFDCDNWSGYGIENIYFYKGIESIHNYSVLYIYGHKFYLHFEGTREDWKDILPKNFYRLENTIITFETFD